MRPAEEKTATLKLEIPNRSLASTLIENWSERSGVSLNILRGRVTSDEACFHLEIRGRAGNVAKILRQSAPWDASRRFMNPVSTGALA
jgi:hypothetical protein